MLTLLKNNQFRFLILSFLTMSGCGLSKIDKITLNEYAPEVAIPLIDTHFTVEDVLADFNAGNVISQDNSGLIRLTYKGDVLELKGDSVFKVTDIAPVHIPLLKDSIITHLTLPTTKGARLFNIHFKAGKMQLVVTNPSNSVVTTLQLSLPDCKKNAQPLSITKTLAPKQTQTVDIDMAGYQLALINNEIAIKYAINATQNVAPLDFSLALSEVKYSYLEGNFQAESFSFPSNFINLSIFDNVNAGKITFSDPTVLFRFQNSLGIPLRVVTKNLSAETQFGGVMNFSAPNYWNNIAQQHYFNFAYPNLAQVGQTQTTSFAFNRSNSNIDDIASNLPKQLVYDLGVVANPSQAGNNFFLTDSSHLKMSVEMELPITGKASNLTLKDTFDVNLSKLSNLKTANFKVIVANGFPMSGTAQLYFCDDNQNVIDSIFVNPVVIPTAKTYINKDNISTSCIENLASFDENRFAQVKQAKKIILKAVMSSSKDVSIFSTANLMVKVGVISKAEINQPKY